jgi:sulfide dehydrogenase cytochrome subunit
MSKTLKMASLAALTVLGGWAQADTGAEARTARYLAATCANCHGSAGTARGATPSLAGLQKNYIVEQMRAFREGKRPATVMTQLAKGYTDQQIELIADYFSRQAPER